MDVTEEISLRRNSLWFSIRDGLWGISSFPILLLPIIFRYFTDEKFPPIMGVIDV
jgi:hypothetical protein